MTVRTIHSTVTFAHPFRLDGIGETWPAGIYEIETDEEDLDSVSLQGRRRIRTIIYRQDTARGTSEAVEIGPETLEAALRDDAARNASEDDAAAQRRPHAPMATSGEPAGGPAGGPAVAAPAVAERRFTPVWVVPLALGMLILLGALYGPFDAPGTRSGQSPPVQSQTPAAPSTVDAGGSRP